jgi:hypothetical protein
MANQATKAILPQEQLSMKLVECWHFSLNGKLQEGYRIKADSHIEEDVDKSAFMKFAELPRDEWNRTSTRMEAIHPSYGTGWFFGSKVDAMAAWEVCIEPFLQDAA